MYKAIPSVNAYTATTELTCVVQQTEHQRPVRLQQMRSRVWAESRHGLIGRERVAYFLDFAGQPEYSLAVEHGGDLFEAQGVVFNGQRSLNRSDAVAAPQLRGEFGFTAFRETANLLTDFCHQSEHACSEGQGRLVTIQWAFRQVS